MRGSCTRPAESVPFPFPPIPSHPIPSPIPSTSPSCTTAPRVARGGAPVTPRACPPPRCRQRDCGPPPGCRAYCVTAAAAHSTRMPHVWNLPESRGGVRQGADPAGIGPFLASPTARQQLLDRNHGNASVPVPIVALLSWPARHHTCHNHATHVGLPPSVS